METEKANERSDEAGYETDGSDQGDAKGRNKRRKVASEANYHIGYKAVVFSKKVLCLLNIFSSLTLLVTEKQIPS